MSTTSGVGKPILEPFILDEAALKRIHSSLERYSHELPEQSTIVYFVAREDYRHYETTDLTDVLSDANASGQRIHTLSIELRGTTPDAPPPDGSDWKAKIDFLRGERRLISAEDKVIINVSSKDRRWAFLLSDDLEVEIRRTFRVKGISRLLILLLLSALISLGAQFVLWARDALSIPIAVLISVALLVLLLIFVGGMFLRSPWYIRAFGPESCFHWGEEARDYDERADTRKWILRGVIVSFLVSLLANIVLPFSASLTP